MEHPQLSAPPPMQGSIEQLPPGPVEAADRSVESLVAAVVQDPGAGGGWNDLGFGLAEDDRVAIGGRSLSKQDCFVEALKRTPDDSSAWNNVGFTLTNSARLVLDGRRYTKPECFIQALRCDEGNAAAWNNLGFLCDDTTAVVVNGSEYGKRDCFLKSLAIEPRDSAAWNNVGFTMGPRDAVQLDGVAFSHQQCFLEALRHDPTNAAAWNNLGRALGDGQKAQVVSDLPEPETGAPMRRTVDGQACFVAAVNEDPAHADAWVGLAKTIPVVGPAPAFGAAGRQGGAHCPQPAVHADGRDMTREACLREALREAPNHGEALALLRALLYGSMAAVTSAFDEESRSSSVGIADPLHISGQLQHQQRLPSASAASQNRPCRPPASSLLRPGRFGSVSVPMSVGEAPSPMRRAQPQRQVYGDPMASVASGAPPAGLVRSVSGWDAQSMPRYPSGSVASHLSVVSHLPGGAVGTYGPGPKAVAFPQRGVQAGGWTGGVAGGGVPPSRPGAMYDADPLPIRGESIEEERPMRRPAYDY